MNMKKKLVAGGLVAALAATAIGGATLAYFTDEGDVSNTFTVGSGVSIKVDEAEVEKNLDNNTWTALATRTEEGVEYGDVYPGAVLPKDPTLTNTSEASGVYARMVVTIDSAAAWKAACAAHNITDLGYIFGGYVEDDWSKASVVENTEADTITYTYEYERVLAAGEKATLFTGVTIPKEFTNAEMTALGDFNIDIQGQAIQADGFANADAAFAALDTELAG